MDHLDESSPGVVALLLDDLAPPRLGTLLRAARKRTGSTRREVAQRVGTTPGNLRRYERGDAPVPPPLIAAFAECYGEELTSQLALRAPIQLEERRLVVGTESRALESDDSDELLAHYVEIVSRLRQSQAGQPIALRADDLVALSSAIGQDTEHVEARIVELLGCTPRSRAFHARHFELSPDWQLAVGIHERCIPIRLLDVFAGKPRACASGFGVSAAIDSPWQIGFRPCRWRVSACLGAPGRLASSP